MKPFFISILLLSSFVFSGCFGGNDTETMQTQSTNTNDYTISIPPDWKVFPQEEYFSSMIFAAQEPNYTSHTPAIITISAENSAPPSLEEVAKRNFEEVRKNSQDFRILSEEKFTTEEIINENSENSEENKNNEINKPLASLLVTYTEKHTENNSFSTIYSLYVVSYAKGKTFVVTLATDANSSETELRKFKQILESFTVVL